MMYIALLLALSATCLALPVDDPAWTEYKLKFGKVYAEVEEGVRYTIWRQNVNEIEIHNADYSNTYKQGVNQFTDMTDEEFNLKMGRCFKIPEEYLSGNMESEGETFVPPESNVALPASIDWRKHGLVGPVKNQGHCGSCYSFAATGALEGQWFKKTGHLPNLSEQQIVDCSFWFGNEGCHGGWYQAAWKYLAATSGSVSQVSYPYEAKQGKCRYNRKYVVAKCTGYVDLKAGDENALKAAVGTIGPVAVAIDAHHTGFKKYSHGVYFEKNCGKTVHELTHAVLVVGYGTEGGQDYWLVKNSWGLTYGSKGYLKMARNRNNHCGIATKASYPKVPK